MTTRYSPSQHIFYPYERVYQALPDDLIEVSRADYDAAMARPPGYSYAFVDGFLEISPPAGPTVADRNAPILAQIAAIENGRQPRAMRDFALTGDKTRLQAIETEITALRAQLQ